MYLKNSERIRKSLKKSLRKDKTGLDGYMHNGPDSELFKHLKNTEKLKIKRYLFDSLKIA